MIYFLIITTLISSAIFSGLEIAYISSNKLDLEVKGKDGSKRARYLKRLIDRPSEFLSSMLVGNNISLVFFTLFLEQMLEAYLGTQNEVFKLLIYTLIGTVIVLIFGEFLPKLFFQIFADKILYIFAIPLGWLKTLLRPLTWLMVMASKFFLKYVLKLPFENDVPLVTRLDLENYVNDSFRKGEEEIETDIFVKALHLKQVKVKECMIPRNEIIAIERSEERAELQQIFIETNLSKIVVYEENIDNITGYVHHQDLIRKEKKIDVREMFIVPESMPVDNLLRVFTESKISIAHVVDEYGGTAGIVTLEDVLEEIFGEIEDEHDQEDLVNRFNEKTGVYIFSGRLELDMLREQYEELKEVLVDNESQTISGFLVNQIGEIPTEEDVNELDEKGRKKNKHAINGFWFEIQMLAQNKIEMIKVYRKK